MKYQIGDLIKFIVKKERRNNDGSVDTVKDIELGLIRRIENNETLEGKELRYVTGQNTIAEEDIISKFSEEKV